MKTLFLVPLLMSVYAGDIPTALNGEWKLDLKRNTSEVVQSLKVNATPTQVQFDYTLTNNTHLTHQISSPNWFHEHLIVLVDGEGRTITESWTPSPDGTTLTRVRKSADSPEAATLVFQRVR